MPLRILATAPKGFIYQTGPFPILQSHSRRRESATTTLYGCSLPGLSDFSNWGITISFEI